MVRYYDRGCYYIFLSQNLILFDVIYNVVAVNFELSQNLVLFDAIYNVVTVKFELSQNLILFL